MTICDECCKVLTDAKGRRIDNAIFDSAIRHKHANDYKRGIIYALCRKCHPKRVQELSEPHGETNSNDTD